MPVVRGCIQGAPSQDRLMELMYDPDQPAEPAQHMYCVHGGEDVKERAVWISSQIQPLRPQLQPGRILGDHKEQTERQRYVQPAFRAPNLAFHAAHKSSNTAACYFA